MPRHNKQGHNLDSAGRLRSFVERIENVEKELEDLRADKSEIYAEAKALGYDTKTIRRIVADRKLSAEERAEQEALFDLYKAALGNLNGTPLGRAAIDRLQRRPDLGFDDDPNDQAPDDQEPPVTEKDIEKAKGEGEKAAKDGVQVTKNPYPALDKRRAAWDEGWCLGSGTDGMDIPEAWKPASKKAKKPDGEETDKADDKPAAKPSKKSDKKE